MDLYRSSFLYALAIICTPVVCMESCKDVGKENEHKVNTGDAIYIYKNGVRETVPPESALYETLKDSILFLCRNASEFLLTAFAKEDIGNYLEQNAIELVFRDTQVVTVKNLDAKVTFKRLLLPVEDYEKNGIMIIFGIDSYQSGPLYYSGERVGIIPEIFHKDDR